MRSEDRVARPLMTAIEARACRGSRPSAAPVSAATNALAALPRYAVGRIVENSPESVTATLIRADDKKFEFTVTWDKDKAVKAGLWGQRGPWSQYPTQMLRARAITEVARQGASEALMGMIYSPEDFGATITDTGEVIEAEIVDDAPAKPAPAANPKPAAKPAAAPEVPASLDKPLTPAQASVAKGLETLSFTQAAYADLCKRCLGQIVAVGALNEEQAATLHTELLAIYNSNQTPAAEPEPVADAEIIDDTQAPIFDYGDNTDPNGGAA